MRVLTTDATDRHHSRLSYTLRQIASQRAAMLCNPLPQIRNLFQHFRLFFRGSVIGFAITLKSATLINVDQYAPNFVSLQLLNSRSTAEFIRITLVKPDLFSSIDGIKIRFN